MKLRTVVAGLLVVFFSSLLAAFVTVSPARADVVFTVTKFDDTADGVCDADCSLREAIIAANNTPGADTIIVPAGTYTLTITKTITDTASDGDLDITDSLTIMGPDGGQAVIVGGPGWNDRVLHIGFGAVASISNVTVQNGNNNAAPGGGGILNVGSLTLDSVIVMSNTTTGFNFGGGIANLDTLTLMDSTVSGNAAGGSGGGVYNVGSLTVINSTLSGNAAAESGGGIYNDSFSSVTLNNVTLTGNVADEDDNDTGDGGGIFNDGQASVKNTLVAGNVDRSTLKQPDCKGALNAPSHTVVGDGTGCGISDGVNGNRVGDALNPIEPSLGPLQDNGGRTPTHALLPGSPAIDAGNPAAPGSVSEACEAADQRGMTRPQGPACDIGAYEVPATTYRLYFPVIMNNP